MFINMVQFLYPDIKKEETLKFCLLGLTLFLILKTYWALLILKEFMIYKVAFPVELGWSPGYGREIIPWIKSLSPIIIITAVTIYTRLIDLFEKHKLFYIFCSFFGIFFSVITIILIFNDIYGSESIGAIPLVATGIVSYLMTECFGSLLVVLFWSFTISCTKMGEAKRTFPFLFALGQLGAISGSSIFLIPNIPEWPIYIYCIASILGIIYVIKIFHATIPAHQQIGDHVEKKQKPDIFAGIRLLLTRPYLGGVFIVSTFYEIAKTIIEYTMLSQADIIGINFKWFMSFYGICLNSLSFVIAFFGASYIIKKLNLQICLTIYPIIFGILLIFLYCYYQSLPSPDNLLWMTFAIMIVSSATGYAINKPTKEIMYIPTSKDVQFKTKGIIDTIGSRSTKAMGMQIARSLNVPGHPTVSIAHLMTYGITICFAVITLWLTAALYVGKKNKDLCKSNKIIE